MAKKPGADVINELLSSESFLSKSNRSNQFSAITNKLKSLRGHDSRLKDGIGALLSSDYVQGILSEGTVGERQELLNYLSTNLPKALRDNYGRDITALIAISSNPFLINALKAEQIDSSDVKTFFINSFHTARKNYRFNDLFSNSINTGAFAALSVDEQFEALEEAIRDTPYPGDRIREYVQSSSYKALTPKEQARIVLQLVDSEKFSLSHWDTTSVFFGLLEGGSLKSWAIKDIETFMDKMFDVSDNKNFGWDLDRKTGVYQEMVSYYTFADITPASERARLLMKYLPETSVDRMFYTYQSVTQSHQFYYEHGNQHLTNQEQAAFVLKTIELALDEDKAKIAADFVGNQYTNAYKAFKSWTQTEQRTFMTQLLNPELLSADDMQTVYDAFVKSDVFKEDWRDSQRNEFKIFAAAMGINTDNSNDSSLDFGGKGVADGAAAAAATPGAGEVLKKEAV